MNSSEDKDDAFVEMSLKSYEGGSLGKDKLKENKEPMLSSHNANSSKRIRTASTMDDVRCGIGGCYLQCCRICAKLSVFTAICSLSSLFSHAITMYISSQIPVLEKQFHLRSSKSGFIISCNEIGFLLTILLASHFGKNWHIPRFMACCTFAFGLATFCMAAAYFVRPETAWDSIGQFVNTHNTSISRESLPHAELDLLCTPHDVQKHHHHDHEEEDCHFKSHENISKGSAAYAIFIVFMILQGMAKAPRSSLVPLYVDNNVSDQTRTGFLMGIIFSAQLLGPGIAFGLGALASRIPVDLNDHGINTEDPRWLGAWWLGFVIIGLSGLLGLPLALFPRSLMKREAIFRANLNSKKNQADTTAENSLTENLKALPKSLSRALKNPVYVFSLLSSTVFLLVIMGLYAFAAKYLEVVFLVSRTKANIIMSCISMVSSALGTMLGGVISSRLRLTVPSLMKVKLIILSLVLVIDISCLFLGCEQPEINNNPEILSQSQKMHDIIHNCSCDHGDFFPICGSDNKNYFSPCYAGCGNWSDFKFDSCSEIPGGKAHPGICDKTCASLYIFMVLFFITDLIGTIDIVPTYLIMIRTQTEKDKAVAMGFGSFILSAFAFLPAPLLFGKFIDMACIIWETDCGIQGSCQLYNISMIRKLLFIPLLGGRFISLVLIIIALWFASRTPQPGDIFRKEVDQAIKEGMETTSL